MFSSSTLIGLTCAALVATALTPLVTPAGAPGTLPFDEATIILEYNASDEDAEVVVDIDADVGLQRFAIVSPTGKEILNLRSRHTEDLGIRKIKLETPEPALALVLLAYPEGWYRFVGKSVDGEELFSQVWLSHALPQAPEFVYPLEGDEDVPTSGASASWTAGPDADSFFLELENDDLGVDVKSNIAGDTTSFGFPAGWLRADTQYQIGIAARGDNGNLTVVEIDFTTAP